MTEQAQRLKLHDILKSFLPPDSKAYFQPPANVKLVYPCIIYQRDYERIQYADNSPYKHMKRYQVTVIDQDPDSEIPSKVARMRYSAFSRFYIADNLNHDVYDVYF